MLAPVRILILEDRTADAELMMAELRRSGLATECKNVTTEREYRNSIGEGWDVVLCDYSLPQFDALHALKVLREAGLTIPLVVVTGSVGEEVAVECIKQGAADYLLKDRLTRLPSAIRQALEQKRTRDESLRTYRAMIESEQRFRALIENSSDGILLLNRSGQVIRCYRAMFTDSAQDWSEGNLFELIHPEDRTIAREAWNRLPQGVQTAEFRVTRRDGAYRWIEALCQDLSEVAGVAGVVLHGRDITERRHLEEQLRHSQKLEAVGQLAAGLGHDFNNLLSVMGGYSSLLRKRTDLPASVEKGLHHIDDACQRATRLTRQLLAFARRSDSKPEILGLSSVVTGLAPLLATLLGKQIELRLNVPPELGRVYADLGEMEQVFMNLATNARDAMGGRGTLTIEGRDISEDGSAQVMIAVTDTGCGMDQATVARVFEPFFTTKESGKGTGLGLSMIYGIVTKAGGRVLVESEVDRGTTFRIILPRCDAGLPAGEIATGEAPRATAQAENSSSR